MAEGCLLVPTRSLSVGYGINMDQFCLVRTVTTDRFNLVDGSKKAVPDSIALSIGGQVMLSSEKPLSAIEGSRRSFGEQDDFAITPEHFLKTIRSGVLAPLTRYDIGGGIIGLNPDNYPILPKAA